MRPDQDIRAELVLIADSIVAHPESAQEQVMRRVRRQRLRRSMLVVTLATAAGLAIPYAAVRVMDLRATPPVPPADRVEEDDFDAIKGRYQTTISGSLPGVADTSTAGTWTITIHQNGEVDMTAPLAFSARYGIPFGISFNRSGDLVLINAFTHCRSKGGLYRIEHRGGGLTFVPERDSCAFRRVALASATWKSVDGR